MNAFKKYTGFIVLVVFSLTIATGCGRSNKQSNQASPSDSEQSQSTTENEKYRKSNVSESRRGVVESINKADREIEAEKTAHEYRIGINLTSPLTIYDIRSKTETEKSQQIRVLLREKRTKRYLPAATVTVTMRDAEGKSLETIELNEIWGEYHFYGANHTIPKRTKTILVSVQAPDVGRHADMRSIHTKPASVTFPVKMSGDSPSVTGPAPAEVPSNYVRGSDAKMAIEESLAIKKSGPYKIGFIAEHSEPYWLPNGTTNEDTKLTMAEIPENANRHLEIVLFERKTNRLIPNADVRLEVRNSEDTSVANWELPLLLSAFYHYGKSVYLPDDTYRIKATVKRPALRTLKSDYFPDQATANFKWAPSREEDNGQPH